MLTHQFKTWSLACLMAVAAISPAVPVEFIYVAAYGSDASPCTENAPCRTIERAYGISWAGAVILLMTDGDYAAPPSLSGNLTVQGQGAGTVVTGSRGLFLTEGSEIALRDLAVDLEAQTSPSPVMIISAAYRLLMENVIIQSQSVNVPALNILYEGGTITRLHNVKINYSYGLPTSGAAVQVETTSGATYKVLIENSSLDYFGRGIVVQGAGNVQLSISDTTISNSAGHGIYINQTGGTTRLTIKDSQIVNNTGIGVMVYPKGSAGGKVSITNSAVDGNNIGIRSSANGSTGTVVVAISDTSASNNAQNGIYADGKTNMNIMRATVSGNQNGISAVAPSVVRVGDSLISGNAVGLQGPISSYGNNQLLGNTTQGAKTPVSPGSVP